MSVKRIDSLDDVWSLKVDKNRLPSATHNEILSGATTDVYFVRTRDVLRKADLLDTPVVGEIFTRTHGVFAGLSECMHLFEGTNVEIFALEEGQEFSPKEVIMRIHGSYGDFGLFETTFLGMLSSSSAWATAARRCVEAADGKPVACFGARHVHPAVAPIMESVAVRVGGCTSASCILGAKLAGQEPSGTIPHAAILIFGDTLGLAKVYDSTLKPGEPRVVLVDTFNDECEEALRIAKGLEGRLTTVRLDTPSERGGVTPELVRELRFRLNMAGFSDIKIIVSGGIDPDRIRLLGEAGADGFGVGSYIAHGFHCDMTMDLKMVNGKPIAKRGRLPGLLDNPRLRKVK